MLKIANCPVGLQTWSCRKKWSGAPSEVLAEIRELGIEAIEVSNMPARTSYIDFKEYCDAARMKILGYHTPALALSIDVAEQVEYITQHCTLLETNNITIQDHLVILNGDVLPAEYGQCVTYMEELNKAATLLVNKQVYFHLFKYHFVACPDKKTKTDTPLKILLETTNSNLIGIQLDTHWLRKAGYETHEELRDDFPDIFKRPLSIHLGIDLGVDDEKSAVALLENVLNWIAFIKSTPAVRTAFIELHYPRMGNKAIAPIIPVLKKWIQELPFDNKPFFTTP